MKMNPKKCETCGREFMSENQEAKDCHLCSEEPLSFKEALLESDEVDKYLKSVMKEREQFMKDRLKENLKFHDRILFFFYKKLADYFGGGKRVITLQERGGYNDSRVGIQIYGTKYWIDEKEFYSMQNEPMPRMMYTEKADD